MAHRCISWSASSRALSSGAPAEPPDVDAALEADEGVGGKPDADTDADAADDADDDDDDGNDDDGPPMDPDAACGMVETGRTGWDAMAVRARTQMSHNNGEEVHQQRAHLPERGAIGESGEERREYE
jgi:hypothetical protein